MPPKTKGKSASKTGAAKGTPKKTPKKGTKDGAKKKESMKEMKKGAAKSEKNIAKGFAEVDKKSTGCIKMTDIGRVLYLCNINMDVAQVNQLKEVIAEHHGLIINEKGVVMVTEEQLSHGLDICKGMQDLFQKATTEAVQQKKEKIMELDVPEARVIKVVKDPKLSSEIKKEFKANRSKHQTMQMKEVKDLLTRLGIEWNEEVMEELWRPLIIREAPLGGETLRPHVEEEMAPLTEIWDVDEEVVRPHHAYLEYAYAAGGAGAKKVKEDKETQEREKRRQQQEEDMRRKREDVKKSKQKKPASSVNRVVRPKNAKETNWPEYDVVETAGSVHVYMNAAGVDKSTLQVQMIDGLLTVSGYKFGIMSDEEKKRKGGKFIVQQRDEGFFLRTLDIPPNIDVNIKTLEASFSNGLLVMKVKKFNKADEIITFTFGSL